MSRLRVGAALALSGADREMGAQAAAGIRAWADLHGAGTILLDHASDPALAADLTVELAGGCELLLGPYGSGAMRAVARRLAGEPVVLWNHGGAATAPTGARVVDVLGPAERYWRGLPAAIRRVGEDPARTAVLAGASGFGAAVADGAVAALEAAGTPPISVSPLGGEDGALEAVERALAAGARVIACGGRPDEELAAAAALAGRGALGAFVVCGVARAPRSLGDAVLGWLGPAQWVPGATAPPPGLDADAEYPAAQAYAACQLAERAGALAGSFRPDALWRAAVLLRTTSALGPYAIDEQGRQVAHVPSIVRWERGAEGPVRRIVWAPAGRAVARGD